MEACDLIPLGERHLIQQCETSPSFYDVYRIKITEKHPDGKLDPVSWGVPLERALEIVAQNESLEDSNDIREFIDKLIASRKEFINKIIEFQNK